MTPYLALLTVASVVLGSLGLLHIITPGVCRIEIDPVHGLLVVAAWLAVHAVAWMWSAR